MGFDKGTITNATVVTISLVAVVGLLVAGATPAAAQSDDPGFNFGDDGGEFGFGSGDEDGGSPGFDFGGGDDTGGPGFSFGGGDDTGGPGFSFGGGDDTGGPGFDFGDDGDGPDFGFGDGEEPDFGGGNDSDDSDQPNVTFVPTIDGTNSPVTEGETLTVDATIENTGTGDGLQTVTLTVDGQVRDSQQISLSGGESTSVSFAWQTQDGDAGDRTASVNTATKDAQTDVTVESAGPGAPANFQVSNLQAPTEATVGDTITVSADVENTGDQQGSQAVEFGVDTDDDGTLEVLASQDETLAGGASTTVTFDVNTSSLAAGTYTHGVSTANDTATAQITLNEPVSENGTIAGTVTDASGSALAGAEVTAGDVSTTTASDGSYSLSITPGDYVVTASADGYQSASNSATVTEGATTTVDFSLTSEDATISGVVQDQNGNNLGGATVSAGSQSATTAADGSYTLTVAPGDYTVEANATNYQSGTQQVTVGSGGSATADFALEPQPEPEQPMQFTGYVRGEESYLHTGTPDNSRPILYSRCRDGQPDPAEQDPGFLPTDECIQLEGTIYPSNNTWRGSVDFPAARDIINETSSDTIGNVYFRANLTTAGQAGGTFNVDTGRTSLETTVDIGITVWTIGSIFSVSSPTANPYDQVTSNSDNRLSDPGCNLPAVSINVSTEKSYQTGSPFPATSTVSGERLNDSDVAKLVSDDFNVDTAEGCGSVFGVNINDQVNAEQGLPAGPGDNEAAYLTEFNIQTGS